MLMKNRPLMSLSQIIPGVLRRGANFFYIIYSAIIFINWTAYGAPLIQLDKVGTNLTKQEYL